MSQTFYELLGVSPDASTGEIETAYREAIKETHPDVSDDVDASERTKRLNRARDVLTDEKERARYDRLGHDAYVNGPTNGRTDGGTATQSASGGPTGPAGGTESAGRSADSSGGSGRSSRSDGNFTPGGFGQWTPGDGSTDDGATDRSGAASGSDASRRSRTARSRRSQGDRARRTGGSAASNGAGGRRDPGRHRAGPSGENPTDAAAGGGRSPSAQRQAAAGRTDGPNPDHSWNAWASTRAWAVRQGPDRGTPLRPSRLFPTDQSLVMLGSTFFLYPFFVFSALYPPFPLVARVGVAACTLLTLAYLLSIPEGAVIVFGLWSVLVPLFLFALPGIGVFSLIGVVALVATWVPFGLSVLTLSVVRP